MDDSTFDGLVAALSVTPENPALLKVVLEAVHHDRRWASGMTVLDRSPRQLLAERPELGLLAAGVALEAALPTRALEWAIGEGADACLLRARACLALERRASS